MADITRQPGQDIPQAEQGKSRFSLAGKAAENPLAVGIRTRQADTLRTTDRAALKKEKQRTGFLGFVSRCFRGIMRLVRFWLVVLLAYLCQVCIVPYLAMGGVTPNVMLAVIAIVIVCHGMLRAYWAGACFGIITDAMMKPMIFFYLLMYPILALFMSVFFADKSEKRLEAERASNPSAHNMHPYLRTPLCAACCQLLYEVVHMLYLYIGGIALMPVHYGRAIGAVIYTTVLTILMMVPVRRMLGFKKPPKEKKQARGRYMNAM
ncbi:MAG: hypothetical protein Q4C54_00520 [Clostridia bacterium]|nr:hypothetical protein [Clostridia bacterium]